MNKTAESTTRKVARLKAKATELMRQGKDHPAVDCLERAVALAPEDAVDWHNLGNLHYQANRNKKASQCWVKALSINPRLAESHCNLGVLLKQSGLMEPAIKAFQTALELKPNFTEARINLGIVYNNSGLNQQACEAFERVLDENPGSGQAFYYLVNSQELSGTTTTSLSEAGRALEQRIDRQNRTEVVYFHFAMGKLCDATRNFADAFDHFSAANRIVRANLDFDAQAHARYVMRIRDTFQEDCLKGLMKWGSPSERPLFIIGMPRSGTTLVEQILSGHSQVYGAGELDFWARFEDPQADKFGLKRAYPEIMKELTPESMSAVSKAYLGHLEKQPGVTPQHHRVTDKMPLNGLLLGLIRAVFPNAKIINCVRNDPDTCLSIFMTNFSQPLGFACDLKECAQYIREYKRLVAHWKTLFPNSILDIVYEELVADPEETVRKMIVHCGLAWEPTCLEFTRNRRPIMTASHFQARQPLYASSVNRWRNYAPFMAE